MRKSPLKKLNVKTLYDWLTMHKKRLAKNPHLSCDQQDDSDVGCSEDEQYDTEMDDT